MTDSDHSPIQINFDFLPKVEKESGIQASACYQCRKCSNGCPLTFAMDYYPDQIVRFLLLGQESPALHSRTIWICSSCETCTTRCPNGIDIAGLMDYLKQEARRRNIESPKANWTLAFHESFLADIKKRGRVHEASLMNHYMMLSGAWKTKLAKGTFMDDFKLGWALFQRKRLPLRSKGVKRKDEIKILFSSARS